MRIGFLCLSVSLLLSPPAHSQLEWAVGIPDGPSTASGTTGIGAGNHFATLEQAVARLSELRAKYGNTFPEKGLTVYLSRGMQRLTAPIVLGNIPGGQEASPVAFIGPADKTAVISGSTLLSSPTNVSDKKVLARLPPEARGSIVQFDLRKEGIGEFSPMIWRGFGREIAAGSMELFFRGRPMTLARWPNDGFAKLQAAPDGPDRTRSFLAAGANLRNLSREPDLMATGYWYHDWADETIPVESVDPQTGNITLQSPGPRFGIKAGQRAFIQNALSELDSPGEWYLDRASGMLYFWPPEPIRKGDVELSVLPVLVITRGASNIRFSGITFEMARGDALQINGGKNVVVEHSTIRNVGGRAANVGGTGHKFIDVDVYDTGEGGIYLWGGDRQKLLPGDLSVENSRFRRFNRLSRTYRPAIQLGGVGNRALGNVISDGTHNAILFYGNDHLIAFNEIYNVATETGDVGAIYTGRDWTARGTVIRNNYLHDIHGPGLHGSRGVYLDDQASGMTIKGNLFVRVDQPVFIGGGRNNVVEDNLFVSSSPAVHVDARGLTWQKTLTNDPQGQLRKKLTEVPYDHPPFSDRYANLASILEDEPGAPKYNVIRRNMTVDSQPPQLTEGADRWVKIESMIDLHANAFRSGAGVLKSIEPIDFSVRTAPGVQEPPSLPLDTMECVASRWRQNQTAGTTQLCPVH